ncbi:MAG TPA: hypothetical protein VFX13_01745 [Gaiellales bacterium]|nr:hypothetical protein [Gaiellales bacterium]
MERGVYFDAWFPRQHNYHPSLPARRLRMIEQLREYRSTTLVWAALGGGSISLPYLEGEAFGHIDPRFRVYGFVNDSEFIAACDRAGIRVFGVVFEAGGWEFPVELDDDESEVLAMNELRGAGTRGWMGLREFSQNRYPKLWKPVEHYFPDGLRNSLGEPVTDIIEECCSRDIHGNPCHCLWVEVPDREHACYAMDRNNPVWREYLKAVIRIQIDAGVHGVQLDEAELPITTMQYGGCFCRECMTQFREYLKGLETAPPELAGVDLETFHYGEWLLGQGYDFQEGRERSPLFAHYMRFQRGAITRYFGELADYAREYGRSRGREVLVSGNFFNMFEHYYALEPKTDLLITEMRNTRDRQPAWYRYVAGFAGGKPVIVVENPYGGVVPELVEELERGRGDDRFRTSVYEGYALGAGMSLPYGSWMGSEIEDAFYAPHELCVEIGGFLAEHEALYSAESAAEVGVVFSIESSLEQEEAARTALANNILNLLPDQLAPFWAASEALCDALQPYDVVMFPDGTLRADTVTAADLARYRVLVLPDCGILTDRQADALLGYLDGGGRAIVAGRLGDNLDAGRQKRLAGHARALRVAAPAEVVAALPDGPQVTAPDGLDAAVGLHRVADGVAVHILRYAYDAAADRVRDLQEMEIRVRLEDVHVTAAEAVPSGVDVELASAGPVHTLRLRDVPLYTIVILRTGRR